MTGRGLDADKDVVVVPDLVGLHVHDARDLGHDAGVVVSSAIQDGPPLGALTWPGEWFVTAQSTSPGSRVRRWEVVAIEFIATRGNESGVREPRRPHPDPGRIRVELKPSSSEGF